MREIEKRGETRLHIFARSRTDGKPCAPYREDSWGNVARHIAVCTLLLVAVERNEVNVGCLQQYQ